MKIQPPSETRARAIEDAADTFDYLQDAPLIAWDGMVNVAEIQARADEALEEAASEREHHEYQVNPWRTDTTVEQKRESASFLMQSTSSWLRDRAKQVKAGL